MSTFDPGKEPGRRQAVARSVIDLLFFALLAAVLDVRGDNDWITGYTVATLVIGFGLTGAIMVERWSDLYSLRAFAFEYVIDWLWFLLFSAYTVHDLVLRHSISYDVVFVLLSLWDIIGPKGRGRGKIARRYFGAKSQALLDRILARGDTRTA